MAPGFCFENFAISEHATTIRIKETTIHGITVYFQCFPKSTRPIPSVSVPP